MVSQANVSHIESVIATQSTAILTFLTETPSQQQQQQGRPNLANFAMPPPPITQQTAPIATPAMPEYNAAMANTMPTDLQSVNPFMPGMDNMSEAWFGQQLLNMDWLDPSIPLQQV